ncbi:shikimate dehydrogenase [Candidatus Peregrinibacteria bacterium]|nr:shikimate dehydrogenase [Candidatus Peregrinibacteria bacterium]
MGGVKKIYGIVGHPVAQSLSPAINNAAFRAAGIGAEYKFFDIDPRDIEGLANFCYETDLNHIAGFTVTMPYKQAVMTYMDHYDPLARMVGSVNTVLNEKSKLIGYNTDARGALEALREKTTAVEGKKTLVLGAGGAGMAILYALREAGANLYVCDKTKEQTEKAAKDLNIKPFVNAHEAAKAGFEIIVNATPVGMIGPRENETLLKAEEIPPGCIVMDIVNAPLETKLIREAKKAGAVTITGERMLLFLSAAQFEIWTKKEAPLEAMEKAMYEALSKRK